VGVRAAMPLRGTGLRMMSGTAEGDSVVAGMVKKLEKEFTPVKLEVIPAYGDPNGSHVTINVVSDAFEGKRPVQRQQLVYKVFQRRAVPECGGAGVSGVGWGA